MTIEIHRPELEALIRERMKSGGFQDVEDVLMQMFQASPLPAEKGANLSDETSTHTGAALVAAMQASPHKQIDLEPVRERLPARDVVF